MTIALFKTLVAIHEYGSFRAAADVICITHAAVGQQMRRLEEILDTKLFDRSSKSPKLNQLGKALVPKVKAVVIDYENILNDLTGDPVHIGELSVGAVPSSLAELVPKSIKRLITLYPQLHIRVVPGSSPDLLEQIENGNLDIAVMSEPTHIHAALTWIPFFEERMVLLTPPEVLENDPLKILEKMPYLRHTRQGSVGMLAEQWLSEHNIHVRDVMEMGSLENLVSMVAHGLGVSIGPDICVPAPSFTKLKKLSLGPTAPTRTLGLLTRSDCSKLRLLNPLLTQINVTIANSGQSNIV
ncbi:MAG: LysR family transcriptional regulator [Paracoccaceae bacterium]